MENKNKLSSVLEKIFSSNNYILQSDGDYFLSRHILKVDAIGKMIFSSEEFSEIESVEIIDSPCFKLENENKQVESIIISDDTKFKGKVYIYSIQLSSECFDLNSFMLCGKDNILLTPILYDSNDFEPKKGITICFNPETAQDMSVPTCVYNKFGEQTFVNKFREHMHKLLDEGLDNQEKYKAKGFRKIMIRGYFPEKPNCGQNITKVKL